MKETMKSPQELFNDSLVEQDRPIRRNLRLWLMALEADLIKCSAFPPDAFLNKVSFIFNQFSLIESYRGRKSRAESLCHHQINLLKSISAPSFRSLISELCIQPWINIGRLYRIRGNYSAALSIFSLFRNPEGARFPSENSNLTQEEWIDIVARNRKTLENVYIIETAKIHLASGNHEELIRFNDQNENRSLYLRLFLIELAVCSAVKQSKYELAMKFLESNLWEISDYTQLIGLVYVSFVSYLRGNHTSAKKSLTKICALFFMSASVERLMNEDHAYILRFIRTITELARHMGIGDSLLPILKLGYKNAFEMGDEPSQYFFATRITELSADNEMVHWKTIVEKINKESHYSELICNPNSGSQRIFDDFNLRLMSLSIREKFF